MPSPSPSPSPSVVLPTIEAEPIRYSTTSYSIQFESVGGSDIVRNNYDIDHRILYPIYYDINDNKYFIVNDTLLRINILIDESYNASISGTDYNGIIYDSVNNKRVDPPLTFTPLPYHGIALYFDPSASSEILYNEILLDSPSPSPSQEVDNSESKFNPYEIAAVNEVLDNLNNNEIVDMVQEGGGQITINTNPVGRAAINDDTLESAAGVARFTAAESDLNARESFASLARTNLRTGNCSTEDTCDDFRNIVGEQIQQKTGIIYTSPGGPVTGTPSFPGPCWRKDLSDNIIKQFPAGHSMCAPITFGGAKARLSRRSHKKKSAPSRMSRRTRRSRRSTRKAGRKGRRSTRRSRK